MSFYPIRNLQMLLSGLSRNERYAAALSSRGLLLPPNNRPPSIPRLQQLLERAWQQGFDAAGRDQLGGRVSGSRKWIGATEIYSLLASARIKAEIMDFHRPTANDGTHPMLFQWVLDYFRYVCSWFNIYVFRHQTFLLKHKPTFFIFH